MTFNILGQTVKPGLCAGLGPACLRVRVLQPVQTVEVQVRAQKNKINK